MTIRVLLFALYRDWAGAEEVEVSVPPGSDAAAAVAATRAAVPGLETLPERPVVAVNSIYSPLDTVLDEGDELAILPPVAGG